MNNYNQYSPQYYQQQFDSQLQQYNALYNQNKNITTTGFVGQYVNSYEEVEKGQVNINGIPTMYVANGVFWIKKFVNGQAYINAYKFEPMNNIGEPQTNNTNNTNNINSIESNAIFESISQSLEKINERLSALENKESVN